MTYRYVQSLEDRLICLEGQLLPFVESPADDMTVSFASQPSESGTDFPSLSLSEAAGRAHEEDTGVANGVPPLSAQLLDAQSPHLPTTNWRLKCTLNASSNNPGCDSNLAETENNDNQASVQECEQIGSDVSLFMGPLVNRATMGTDSLLRVLGEGEPSVEMDNFAPKGRQNPNDGMITEYDLPSRAVADRLMRYYGESVLLVSSLSREQC